MFVSLSLTHLRIDWIARSQFRLSGYQAGERLRNCLVNVILRATCAENPRRAKPDPEHAANSLTLFGDGFRFLPYLVLALPEMGREGVGPGRGQFDLRAVWAVDPLTEQVEPVLSPGDNLVHVPSIAVNW